MDQLMAAEIGLDIFISVAFLAYMKMLYGRRVRHRASIDASEGGVRVERDPLTPRDRDRLVMREGRNRRRRGDQGSVVVLIPGNYKFV